MGERREKKARQRKLETDRESCRERERKGNNGREQEQKLKKTRERVRAGGWGSQGCTLRTS